MLSVIGHKDEAERILADVRGRRREHMVKGDL